MLKLTPWLSQTLLISHLNFMHQHSAGWHLELFNSEYNDWKSITRIEDLILTFWKLSPEPKRLIYWSGDYKEVQGLFKKWGLNPQFLKTPQKAPWVEFITHFWGGKSHKKWLIFFERFPDAYKKYILQKNWTKTLNPALSSDVNILHPAIWGSHSQLDDHHRNPNINNRSSRWLTNFAIWWPNLEPIKVVPI